MPFGHLVRLFLPEKMGGVHSQRRGKIKHLGLSRIFNFLNRLLFPHSTPFRKAKALYACKAEHDSELSFTAGTIFDNGEFLVPSQVGMVIK